MLGSLSALRALESAASTRHEEKVKFAAQSESLQSQKEKMGQLTMKRDKLMEQLHNATTGTDSGKEGESSVCGAETQDPELQSALAYLSELQEKLNVYKLAGVSVVKTNQDSKVLCFTTSHRGVYLEAYHLKLQRLTSGCFKVVQHDLPPFIVFSTLPADLEVKDMMSAVRPLQEALSMFVHRREELKTAQSLFPDTLHVVESSAAVDFVCCHLDISDDVQVEITLKYTDLNHYLPSSVSAVLPLKLGEGRPKQGFPEDIASKLQEIFFDTDSRLCEAFQTAAETLGDYFSPQL
ncbi:uncharacterized protein [Littorina saxatilis]|uniref:Centromere protein O n=1 Tax=Littorina saxatilis TaxID=31220 RepID=A0AAN9ASS6_9CAEN